MAKESTESCRFGKTLVCPKCRAASNLDFSADLILDYLVVRAVCPSCGREFKATLESFANNKSIRKSKKESAEVRETSRMGKSFVCTSCGMSIDFDLTTDATLKEVNVAGCCPECYADIFLTLDSFLNNRAVLICPDESEGKVPAGRKKEDARQKKHKQKAEKLDYIR